MLKRPFEKYICESKKIISTLDRRLEKKMTEKKQIACAYFIYAMKWDLI